MNTNPCSMNPCTGPDIRLADNGPMTLRDVRDVLDRVHIWISEGYTFHDTLEYDGEVYTGADMMEDARRAESALYLLERRK
jgi:hypothetical protein